MYPSKAPSLLKQSCSELLSNVDQHSLAQKLQSSALATSTNVLQHLCKECLQLFSSHNAHTALQHFPLQASRLPKQ